MARYDLQFFDVPSGEPVSWVPKYSRLQYTRQKYGQGQWQLDISDQDLDWNLGSSKLMLAIKRGERMEMAGPVFQKRHRLSRREITLSGYDLRHLVYRLLIRPETIDMVNNVRAETAIRHYISGWGAQAWNLLWSGLGASFAIEPIDQERGIDVSYVGRYDRVLDVVTKIAKVGGLWFDIVFDEEERIYRLEVHEVNSNEQRYVFSDRLGNVADIDWQEKDVTNILYGMGQGTSDGRTIFESEGSAGGLRYESRVDLRNTDDDALPSQTGAALTDMEEKSQTIQLELNKRSIDDYRNGWDIGQEVIIEDTPIGVSAIRSIESVTITQSQQDESFRIGWGDAGRGIADLFAKQDQQLNQVIAI